MRTRELEYDLPPELVAQTPIEPRDASRLLVIHRDTGRLEHRIFHEIGEYLRPGDLVIANESRVIPARLRARKAGTGGAVEILLLRQLSDLTWEALVGGKHVLPATRLEVLGDAGQTVLQAEIVEALEGSQRIVRFDRPVAPFFGQIGAMPLPPYIRTRLTDSERYQTIYSRTLGSAAAPTAGLHFTPDLMVALRRHGIEFGFVTLHVGLDTFKPVDEETVEVHHIHTEWCALSPEVSRQINQARLAGRRVIAVGTTSVRVLESAARQSQISNVKYQNDECADSENSGVCAWQTVSAFEGFTDLYIYPGYQFRVVDAMITNFHLPRSTLLALVSAFAGRETILRAYQAAIQEHYRFYSFGDATLIL